MRRGLGGIRLSEREKITRAAGIVGFFTFLSRLAGFARDLVTAYFFGAGLAADAFFVAFRVPNQLRRLLAEGCLTVAFIPVYTEYVGQRAKDEAQEMVSAMLGVLLVVLIAVVVVGIALSPAFIAVTAPGFISDPAKFDLTVLLTRLMFPYVMMVSLVAFFMGILNTHGHFGAPAFSTVLLNVCIIAAVFLLYERLSQPVMALAVGVLVGGLAQVLIQLPYLARYGIRLRPSLNFRHPAVQRILYLMLPAVLGVAVYQFNVFIGTLLASLLPEGSVSYLYYATRLVEFPLGIVAMGLGTAVLPSMSRQAAAKDIEGLRESISYALRLVMFINAPAMVGLIVYRLPIVSVLFERGRFDPATSAATADALLAYAVGLWAVSAVRVIVPAYYSLQDTRTPVRYAIVALVVNIVFSVALMGPLRHVGLALANSLAAVANMGLLLYSLRVRLGRLGLRRIILSVGKTALASAGMAAVIIGVARLPWGAPESAQLLALDIGLGVGAYFLLSYFIRNPELQAMTEMFRTAALRLQR
jgi:putative peptidoglycan lipid II flippase